MFFYTIILLACLIAAFVIPLIYRLITGAGTVIHETIMPNSETGSIRHSGNTPAGTSKASTAWNLRRHDAPLLANGQTPDAGWLRHETRSELVGRTYKVARQEKVRKKNPGVISKPASWA